MHSRSRPYEARLQASPSRRVSRKRDSLGSSRSTRPQSQKLASSTGILPVGKSLSQTEFGLSIW